ncbi:hypothetical protein LAZ67_8003150 [Cordylochernes scorpioides]|uniref:Uncharacterized protein n=1 Tax=Cordylochernes scorpioides TaxID=51811 RepID=A0ABY6KUL8_9ARAC|nr:hypothetical protein LAZ67_8003150 [Cordylochernes scorpioides]
MGLLERTIARWSPFVRGLSLVGRDRAANCLVLGSILHHFTATFQLKPPSAGCRRGWHASCGVRVESRGSLGAFGLAQSPRGVQSSLRGAANGYSWLVRSRTWMTSPAPDVWLSPRRRRLLSLWESVSSILELNHRILHPASLRSLRLRGDNRFLRLPDLLAPDRWLQMTVGDISDGFPALLRSTRATLLDAQYLGIFCQRFLQENASFRYHAEYEAETIVLRGSTTPITRLNSQSARRALDTARLQAHSAAELAARWDPTVDVPRSISWADLRCNCFSGHDADVALRLALHALPHPDHPASRRANCAACGSSDGSLAHRYWSCRAVRPLLREVFASCEMPLDLQAWLFGVGLHPEGMKITSPTPRPAHSVGKNSRSPPVAESFPRFKAGRISIEDDPRQGRPKFQRTDENVQKFTDLIKENPRTTLLELEQDTGISKTTIGRIVTEDLRLKKTPAKFIPRFLTNEQKLCRLATCEDMMEMTRTDPEWKDKIITGDETWVYGYDPETKPQSAEWRG